MNRYRLAKFLGILIALSGTVVMAGWFLGIRALESISPAWVTMKFSTALCFFLSGTILCHIASFRKGKSELAAVILPVTTMVVYLLMGTLLISNILGIEVGVETLFVKEAEGAIKSVVPGRPSAATMINFILIATAGVLTIFNVKKLKTFLTVTALIVGLSGATAVFGYILNMPILYFETSGVNTAMALHTAVLFVLAGIGLTLNAYL